MNVETTRPRGRSRNRWLDEVREDGRMVGGEEWQEKVYDREEWKRPLRTARNHHILYMPMGLIHSFIHSFMVKTRLETHVRHIRRGVTGKMAHLCIKCLLK